MKKITVDFDKTLDDELARKLMLIRHKVDLYIVSGRKEVGQDVRTMASLLGVPDSRVIMAGSKKGEVISKINPVAHLDDKDRISGYEGKVVSGKDFNWSDHY